jgi:DNA-binding CsgD family transcriptional regulator
MRSAEKISAYINKYVTRPGIEKREEVFALFDNMHQFFPQWVISTCPVMHPDIQYMTKNGPLVFGFSNEYLLGNSGLHNHFNHVHDADQQDLYHCMMLMQEHLESIPPEEHHRHRAVFSYRFRKGDGQYMILHDERATLKLGNAGNLYYGLFRDVTAEKKFSGVKVELFMQDPGVVKIMECKPVVERSPLSKREGQLVSLIRRGLSTKEIAGHLNISHNTVRNIKSRLFEKYNVTNSIELLNMTG